MGRQLHEKCGNEVGGAHIKVQGCSRPVGTLVSRMWSIFSKRVAWDVHRTAEYTRGLRKYNKMLIWVRLGW